jgi:asparagine synthase (glutamine-hydrolysing)
MNKAISHRGDDDEGYLIINQWDNSFQQFSGSDSPEQIKSKFPLVSQSESCSGNIGFGHRRFSIIDVSVRGHQPLFINDKSLCITYNGEIYNYVELKEELLKKGYRFNSDSDTEVLLNAYREWGSECFNKLNGFWALAIYDFHKKELILSRDRMGKKPLYWCRIENLIYFASEIKSLLEIPEISQNIKVNDSAVSNWIHFGLRDTTADTFFKGIFSFPAASYSVVDMDYPNKIKNIWKPDSKRLNEKELSEEDAAINLRDLLQDSIKIRLRADVPWCVELSGGMDSSSILGVASKFSKNPVTAFTVKFHEKEWDEEHFARFVAEKFQSNYIVVDSPTEDFWKNISAFTYLEEEPYHSPNLQTNQIIWSLMREKGIKVSLNGAAGDELFAGYGNYYAFAQLENLSKFRFFDFYKNLKWTENKPLFSAIAPFYIFLKHAQIPGISDLIKRIKNSHSSLLKSNSFLEPKDNLLITDELFSDIFETKIPYWLRSGDKGYMGVPFEVRAPFLDYRIVEYALKLPSSYLVKDGWHKWILRKALEDILPSEVNWRRHKLGFPFPLKSFLSVNSTIINEIVNKSENPFLNYKRREKFKDNWKIISFILWYEYFINRNDQLFRNIENFANQKNSVPQFGFMPRYIRAMIS